MRRARDRPRPLGGIDVCALTLEELEQWASSDGPDLLLLRPVDEVACDAITSADFDKFMKPKKYPSDEEIKERLPRSFTIWRTCFANRMQRCCHHTEDRRTTR
jgi:hypothetical protein